MDLITLLLLVAAVGLIVWGLVTLVPMPAEFKMAIPVIALLAVLLFVLSLFADVPAIRVGR